MFSKKVSQLDAIISREDQMMVSEARLEIDFLTKIACAVVEDPTIYLDSPHSHLCLPRLPTYKELIA